MPKFQCIPVPLKVNLCSKLCCTVSLIHLLYTTSYSAGKSACMHLCPKILMLFFFFFLFLFCSCFSPSTPFFFLFEMEDKKIPRSDFGMRACILMHCMQLERKAEMDELNIPDSLIRYDNWREILFSHCERFFASICSGIGNKFFTLILSNSANSGFAGRALKSIMKPVFSQKVTNALWTSHLCCIMIWKRPSPHWSWCQCWHCHWLKVYGSKALWTEGIIIQFILIQVPSRHEIVIGWI